MNNLDWSQFTVLDHLVAVALILGYVLLTALLAMLAVNIALRVFAWWLGRALAIAAHETRVRSLVKPHNH